MHERARERRRWIEIVLAGGGAALFLLLVVLLLSRGGLAPTLPPTPVPTSPADPPVAMVNGQPIGVNLWAEAVLIDQVMSGLAGVPAPSPEETLEQLVNQVLVLQAAPSTDPPSDQEVEAYIAALEAGWGVSDEQVVQALEAVGLDRETWKRAVTRLLAVQRGQEALVAEGTPIDEWLARERERAEIVIYRERMAQAVAALSPSPSPSPLPSPSPSPSPLPGPPPAPDFTLEEADGELFTLYNYLAEGPVVLVFFQRCG
ncbi:MAG TPA: hypothetical protein G4O00_07165 [Thermoflexia bacterium]|jgi:hypothetical protein|nr:hypothetical protein [Thermoflexia bacterium]